MANVSGLYSVPGVQGVLDTGAFHLSVGIDPHIIQSPYDTLRICDALHAIGFDIVTFLVTGFGTVAIVRPSS